MRYWKEAFREEIVRMIALEASSSSSYLCLDFQQRFLQGGEVWDAQICVYVLQNRLWTALFNI